MFKDRIVELVGESGDNHAKKRRRTFNDIIKMTLCNVI